MSQLWEWLWSQRQHVCQLGDACCGMLKMETGMERGSEKTMSDAFPGTGMKMGSAKNRKLICGGWWFICSGPPQLNVCTGNTALLLLPLIPPLLNSSWRTGFIFIPCWCIGIHWLQFSLTAGSAVPTVFTTPGSVVESFKIKFVPFFFSPTNDDKQWPVQRFPRNYLW